MKEIQIKNYPQHETPMMKQYGNSIRRASNFTTPLYVLYAMYVQLAGLSRIGQTGDTAKSRRLTYAGHRWGGGFYLLPFPTLKRGCRFTDKSIPCNKGRNACILG